MGLIDKDTRPKGTPIDPKFKVIYLSIERNIKQIINSLANDK